MIIYFRNRYKKGDISAEDILNGKEKFDVSLQREVYIDFVKNAPLQGIEKYKANMTKESLNENLQRINPHKHTHKVPKETHQAIYKQ